MSYRDRIRECTRFDPSAYRPFRVDGCTVGFVKPDLAQHLLRYSDAFRVTADDVQFTLSSRDPGARTDAFDAVVRDLNQRGAIKNWRGEPFAVVPDDGRSPLFTIDRAAVPAFGIRASGVHVNGYVRNDAGLHMWIGRRSKHKHLSPNKLDQIVAGGKAATHSILETLIKEGEEEANLPGELARRAVPVGVVTYSAEIDEGLRRDTLHIFDIELPKSFVPKNNDGEIAEFFLLPIEEVQHLVMETTEFKFNCALVVIDFLIRHGFIDSDDPDYVALCTGLRSRQI
jgi:8-oxo-dGTP pyrophosphatase MutT (NUDIX family)